MPENSWPELPLEAWKDTYATLHMWTQIVGKVRASSASTIVAGSHVNSCGLTSFGHSLRPERSVSSTSWNINCDYSQRRTDQCRFVRKAWRHFMRSSWLHCGCSE
jgi:hypothetical protein